MLLKLWLRLWAWCQKASQKYGVNPVMLGVLVVSWYLWLPIAPFLKISLQVKGAVSTLLFVAPFVYMLCGLLWRFSRGKFSRHGAGAQHR